MGTRRMVTMLALLVCVGCQRTSDGGPGQAETARGNDALVADVEALRKEACACTTRPCFAATESKWDRTFQGSQRLKNLSPSVKEVVSRAFADITGGCEKAANTRSLGEFSVTNECTIGGDPNRRYVSFTALVPTEFTDYEGNRKSKKTIYTVQCRQQDPSLGLEPWACSGAYLHADKQTLDTSSLGPMSVALVSLDGTSATITWGVQTFTVDTAQGTVAYRDQQDGRGQAQCAADFFP